MILKLYKQQITILQNNVPDDVNSVHIEYQYELGTNHLNPVLKINGTLYKGDNIDIKLDLPYDELDFIVYLLDAYANPIKTYTGTFKQHRMCSFGDTAHIDIYKELERLYTELKQLKEKGDIV